MEQGETGGQEALDLLARQAAARHPGEHGEAAQRLEPGIGERAGRWKPNQRSKRRAKRVGAPMLATGSASAIAMTLSSRGANRAPAAGACEPETLGSPEGVAAELWYAIDFVLEIRHCRDRKYVTDRYANAARPFCYIS